MKKSNYLFLIAFTTILFLLPETAYADVESTLVNFATVLSTRIMPLIAVLGIIYAGFSFITGNPGAKQHLFLAIIGVILGLSAKFIVDMVKGLVH
jgi:type IV secretion system protein VirB2